jgi:hypothetical protein
VDIWSTAGVSGLYSEPDAAVDATRKGGGDLLMRLIVNIELKYRQEILKLNQQLGDWCSLRDSIKKQADCGGQQRQTKRQHDVH